MSALAQVSFEGLGDLPGGRTESIAQAVSADGSTVVGQSGSSDGTMAFRWTQSGGMTGLGYLPGGANSSIAYGVSADGSVVVGQSNSPGFQTQAFRWSGDTGMTGLGDLAGGSQYSIAYAVSADGKVIVGTGVSGSVNEAVRWVVGAAPERLHIHSGAYAYSSALTVSADGAVAGGFGMSPATPAYQAFLWVNGEGADLGVLPGAFSYSFIYGLSEMGDVAVGWSLAPDGIRAFRWTVDQGMAAIPGLPGETLGIARAVSSDGSVVVGTENTTTGRHAFLWTEANGTVAISDFLADHGIDLSGWILTEAVGLSVDGTCIVGNGQNPNGDEEAWLVRIIVNTDSDGDGINDDADVFPNSDMRPTLVLDGGDTSVPNHVFADGSTMADLIAMCADRASNHGGFVSGVAQLTKQWMADELITSPQRAVVQRTAARAHIP